MPYTRQFIQSAPLGAQMNRDHQFTRTPEGKHPLLKCHSHYCFHQGDSYKRLDYLSLPDKCDLTWDSHTVSGSMSRNISSGWKAATSRWKDLCPLTPEFRYLVSKSVPLREWPKRGSSAALLRESLATIVIAVDWLRNAAPETALQVVLGILQKNHGSGRRWLLEVHQMTLLLLSSLFSSLRSLMRRTSVHKCYHLSHHRPAGEGRWFYNCMCLRVNVRTAVSVNMNIIKIRTAKTILISFQSLRKIF